MMMMTDARYEDECGEWAYDYRMEEYGYTLDPATGDWVPLPDSTEQPSANGYKIFLKETRENI